MLDYLRRLVSTGFAYTAASVVSKVIAVLLLPLYTSYLSPTEYGQAELLFSTVVAASIVIRLGLIEALLRFYYLPDERGDRVIATGFAALFWATTAGALVALPFASQIGDLLSGEALDPGLVRIAIGGLWVLTLYEYMSTLFRVDERARAYFGFTIGNVLVAIALTVALVVGLDAGAEGLLLGAYVAGLPFLLWLIVAERRRLALWPERELLRRMFRFGLPTMPAEISIYSLAFVDRIIIAHSLGPAQLGLYGLAFKFSQAIQVVVRGFQLAWPPLAYSIRDDEEARRTYAVVVTAFTALCGLIVVAMWLEARWIVRLLAAPDFFDSYEAIGPLALGAALYGIYLALVVILGRTGKTQYNFPVTIAATVANVALNLILVPAWGIVGAGVALIASYLIVIVLIYLVSRRIFPIPWQWGRLAVVVGAAAALIAAGEVLLPTDGAAGFLSRLALIGLYPLILWFGGAVRPDERRQVAELLSPERLRARWADLRARRAAEGDEQARAEELYEQEIRDQR
ncbi:MAG TPA: oligosaccharide flippase family protein [Solirubrobacterales bacterium]|nr:oligosaccharide flippase family protein [Solirubrobacterales bacterium]